MILAAGRGARMGALTAAVPKPLLMVNGRFLIDYALRALAAIGVCEIVINVCYHREQIIAALGNGERFGVNIAYSIEETALETGGGILQALPLLGPEPFIVHSADIVCHYPLQNLLQQPAGLGHLIMVPNPPFHPRGDYGLQDGWLTLEAAARYTFGSIGVYRPELFAGIEGGRFSLDAVLRPQFLHRRISGEVYQGFWHNIGDPAQLVALAELRE